MGIFVKVQDHASARIPEPVNRSESVPCKVRRIGTSTASASSERGPQAADSGGQFHQPSRAIWIRIASARANTVLAVGHVASSKGVERIDRISRVTRSHRAGTGAGSLDQLNPPEPVLGVALGLC